MSNRKKMISVAQWLNVAVTLYYKAKHVLDIIEHKLRNTNLTEENNHNAVILIRSNMTNA